MAAEKHENIAGLEPTVIHGHSVIGRIRENSNNKFDLMYYFPDYKIKISFANQNSKNNHLADGFSKNLICLTA